MISTRRFTLTAVAAVAMAGGAFAQPAVATADQTLYNRAMQEIEHRDLAAARLDLNTLINMYPTSAYGARAKLAIAVSWLRQGDARSLAQAEAEYRDFIRFYPEMKEAADAQVGEPLRMIREQEANRPR